MKKIFSIITILALVISLSSCGNKKKKDSVGTHAHEDGTVHANDAHSHDDVAKPAQESFEVKEVNDTTEHQHDADEHGHEHGDEAEHDHDSSGDEHSHENGEHN